MFVTIAKHTPFPVLLLFTCMIFLRLQLKNSDTACSTIGMDCMRLQQKSLKEHIKKVHLALKYRAAVGWESPR